MLFAQHAILAFVLAQSPTPLTRNTPIELTLGAQDGVLAGHGPSRSFTFKASQRCRLLVWSRSRTVDPFVRVEDASGKLVVEDDNSGDGTTAFARTEAEAGSEYVIRVATHAPGEIGQLELALIEVPHLGAADLETAKAARALLDEAKALGKLRKFDEARAKLRSAIEGYLALDGAAGTEHSQEVSDGLWEAGYAAADLHDLKLTRTAWGAVLEQAQKRLPDEHPFLQSARLNYSNTIADLGDLASARPLQEHVLEVYTRTRSEDHVELQRTRMNLAITLAELGELEAARPILESALLSSLRTQAPDSVAVQRVRLNLAATIRQLGDLTRARSMLEEVVRIDTHSLPKDHADLQKARLDLAHTLRQIGDLAGARELEEQVIDIFTRTLPADHPDLQTSRLNLSLTIKAMGDLEGAHAIQEEVLQNLSDSLPADNPHLAEARTSVGITLGQLRQFDKARALFDLALSGRSAVLSGDAPELQSLRNNVAWISLAQGDVANARQLLEQVLEVRARTLPPENLDLEASRYNVATVIACDEFVRGPAKSVREREEDRQRYLAEAREYANALRHSTLQSLFSVSPREAEERAANQIDGLSRALCLVDGFGALAPDGELEELAFLASETARAVALSSERCARLARLDPGYAALRARLRSASDELVQRARAGAAPADLRAARTEIEATQLELLKLARQKDGKTTAVLEPRLADLAQKLGPHDALVGYRGYERLRLEQGLGLGEYAHEIDLCAFVLCSSTTGQPRLTRIELGPIERVRTQVERWRSAIAKPIERGVPAAGADPGRASIASEVEHSGEALRALVFDPLRPALAEAQRIVFALDDVLHLVPLDALPDAAPTGKKDRKLLGESFRIETRPSLLELLEAPSSPSTNGTLIALGHPDLDREPMDDSASANESAVLAAVPRNAAGAGLLRGGAWERGFLPLPETGAEVHAIRDFFVDEFGTQMAAVVLERRKASRESLFELAPKARFLHIATHGWFAPESVRSFDDPDAQDERAGPTLRTSNVELVRGMSPMLLCGLALAGANLPADATGRIPGLVTAQELATVDLSNCELAVLSACDTNVGVRRAGQGVASLQKALHMAGARTVITSLWKVPDEATKELMVDFYRRIWVEKKAKGVALWEAKMKLRNAKDELGRALYSPRDWAGWMLTGEAD